MNENQALAQANLERMRENSYPGRGIVAGLNPAGTHFFIIYFVMGRSDNSRNRVFTKDLTRVYTEAANPALVTNPSLIMYDAMLTEARHHIVSNGAQTKAVQRSIKHTPQLEVVLRRHKYEPDEPHFTPRITAVYSLPATVEDKATLQLLILRKSRMGNGCDRIYHRYDTFAPGFGWCISTYQGDGNPLPSFTGEPILMPMTDGDAKVVAHHWWQILNEENRVALVAKSIAVRSGSWDHFIVNKRTKVA